MRQGVSVCIYCGEQVPQGFNCCAECLKGRTKAIAIGAMLGNLEFFVELFHQALKKIGWGMEDET